MELVTLVSAAKAKLNDNLVFPFCFQIKKWNPSDERKLCSNVSDSKRSQWLMVWPVSHLCFVAASSDHRSTTALSVLLLGYGLDNPGFDSRHDQGLFSSTKVNNGSGIIQSPIRWVLRRFHVRKVAGA
jgi:hypothetical protein